MNLLLTASSVFTLIALYFVVSMIRHARRRRPVRATRSLAGGTASAVAGGASIMLAFSYYGYGRLVDEQTIGRIGFTQSAPEQFVARLMLDDQQDRMFELLGNEWQMDARVVTWKPPATMLGLDPIFQLDRLSGRYSSLDDERSKVRSVHSLSEPIAMDVWRFARKYPKLMPGVDAHYGTATYLPMVHGAVFEVTMTRTGLIARPVNEEAEKAVGDWGQ
ncbi:MAG: cation/multidrug efflux pump [Gammaproteobacteria bacterium]|nr:cation/multidrug efflux pump [Gammaproteobacteria bacterium]MDH5619744.1 cation/multidrug efflux pump [Gammaproteobacteria bacterium]